MYTDKTMKIMKSGVTMTLWFSKRQTYSSWIKALKNFILKSSDYESKLLKLYALSYLFYGKKVMKNNKSRKSDVAMAD